MLSLVLEEARVDAFRAQAKMWCIRAESIGDRVGS